MYYYAVLNTKDIVEYISEQETEVTYYEYISIPTADQSLVGKWYDREGLYGTVGAFLEAPISILAEHSSSQISYKGQDVWLDDKLDSYVTQSNLSSELEGKANVSHSHNAATKTVDGFMSAGDKAKLDGIESNANLYVHPETHAASMITGLSAVSTSGSYNDLTDKPTIPTIPAALPADGGNADTLDGYHAAYFASGQHNHDGVYAAANHTHDYAASNHSHATATTTAAGFMSKEDKAKLNGIASGANSYTHPASHPASMITETDSLKVMTAAERTKLSGIAENANNYTHPETHSAAMIEETSLKKVMTAEERTKLAGIESGANNYSHPSTHPASMITGLSDIAISGSYEDLSNKPTSMTPTAHTHAQSEITGLETALSGKASSTHTHAQSDITGLATALSGKSDTSHTHTAASTSVAGFMSAADKTKLNGIAANANAYTHPSTHAASMITGLADVATSGSYDDLSDKPTIPAAYTHPSTHPASMITGLADIATSGSYNDLSDTPTSMTPKAHTHAQSDITGLATALSGKSDTSHSHSNATTTAAGFMSKDDKSKLDGIAAGANKTTVDSALSSTSTNPVQNKVINTALSGKAASSHTHSVATTSAAGFMSKDDKTKLNGIATGANNYTHPSTHAASMITGLAEVATSGSYTDLTDKPTSMTPTAHSHAQSDITGLATALSGKSDTTHTHSAASTTANGFMSKEDKTKLNGIATGANKTTVDSALSSTSTNPVQNKVINTALAGKAASSHTHAQSDITGLATALSGKSDTTHTHSNATSSTNGFMSATDKSAFDTAKNRGQIGVCKNVLTTGENLDDYIYSGTYTFGGTYTPENIPAGVNGWLVVLRWSCSDENATVKQFWFRHGTVGANDFEIYVRTKVGSAAFGSWSKIYTTSNPPTAAEVGAISKDLQMTADDGDVYVSWSNQDVVSKITALKKGMYTAYAQSGTTNNPKTTEGWRFLIHKTTDTVGWVQAFGSSGSVYVGNVDSDGWKGWKCVYDADPSPLWTGKLYMSGSESSPQTVTPSKKLSECRTGYLLVWSDYDPDTSTANDADFVTTFIPKKNPTGGNWSGKSFLCDIPRYIGSNVNDVDTERRIMKILYIYDNRIVGSPNNSKDDRNDVVLRCIWEI